VLCTAGRIERLLVVLIDVLFMNRVID